VTAAKTRRRTALLVAGTLLAICGVVVLSLVTRGTPYLRDRVVAALNGRFQSQVAVERLQVGIFPRPEVSGSGLVLRHNGRTDVPPLITLESFTGSAGLLGLFATPLSLRSIELEGLTIHVPPGGLGSGERSGPGQRPNGAAVDAHTSRGRRLPSLSIGRIRAREARLELVPRNPAKSPRVFAIHDLLIDGFRPDAPADFHARLTNPVPRGEIDTSGQFGPWAASDPASTKVRGHYTFEKANLDTIKGIGGILSSTGEYEGALERIVVKGQTDTPAFQLDTGGRAVPLKTRFHAVVDGTNGDTLLEDVQARLADTPIQARGAVVRAKEVKGRHVSLDITIDEGRIEDVLRLAADADKPPLTGRVSVQSKVLVPAGDEKVIDRLELDGRFALAHARFTSYNVQKRITELSRRARGQTGDASGESVVSNMSGRFVLRDGVLRFTHLTFAVPGAVVRLDGTYALRSQRMDFTGDLLLDATLAETTTGVKALLAKIFQPMFRGPKGGTKLPIKVAGTREKPEFGLDVKRAFTPGK
jgi:AsmA-like C-terminal region